MASRAAVASAMWPTCTGSNVPPRTATRAGSGIIGKDEFELADAHSVTIDTPSGRERGVDPRAAQLLLQSRHRLLAVHVGHRHQSLDTVGADTVHVPLA